MKLKTIVLNLNPQSFLKQFVKSTHILFREMEYKVFDINGDTITMKLGEKNSEELEKELQVTCIKGHEVGHTYIIFDVVKPFGYKNMISPSFNVAAWMHNEYHCNQFVDVDTGVDVNVLGRTGGMRMSVHNTSDTPVKHDLGVFTI